MVDICDQESSFTPNAAFARARVCVFFMSQGRFYSCTDEAKHTPEECKSVSVYLL